MHRTCVRAHAAAACMPHNADHPMMSFSWLMVTSPMPHGTPTMHAHMTPRLVLTVTTLWLRTFPLQMPGAALLVWPVANAAVGLQPLVT